MIQFKYILKSSKHTGIMWFLLGILLCVMPSHANDIVIIASKESVLTSITPNELKKLFIGKNTSIDNTFTIPVIQKNKSSHKEFLDTYLNMNSRQFARTWQKLVFTGKAQMPTKVSSTHELIQMISSNTNTLGYIYKNEVTPDVKIIAIEE